MRIGCNATAIPRAFSLIELLIVVAIILILTTMYWGSGAPSRQRQQRATCQKNLQTLYIAMQIYANEHASKFPVIAGASTSEQPLDLLVPRYTADTSVFICPGSKDSTLPSGAPISKRTISYAYFMGRRAGDAQELLMSDRLVDPRPKTNGDCIFSVTGKPPGNNHGKAGGNFLFCDGHADASPPQAPFSIVLTQGVVLLNPRH
jgi:prepilin-type N-terminal cleavage/methylation domain-containing protein/prepilin-type processing-associated H-X9-DG protein